MGLRGAFGSVATAVVRAFGDVAVEAAYWSHASTVVDTSTGAATSIFATVPGVRMIVAGFTAKEIDGQVIRKTDQKGLVPAPNLPGVRPKESDRLVIGSATWQVMGVKTDPAEALWQLHLRK